MENYDSNIMPSSNNNKELEDCIHMSCKSDLSFKWPNLCLAADSGGLCIAGGGRSVPAGL